MDITRELTVARECRDLARKLTRRIGGRRHGSDQRQILLRSCLWMLMAKAYDTFDALCLLGEHGWGEEAMVLLRVLVETVTNASFIFAHPNTGLFLYLEDTRADIEKQITWFKEEARRDPAGAAQFEARVRARESEKQELTGSLADILGKPPRDDGLSWSKKGKRLFWRDIPVARKFEMAGLTGWYETVYRLTCSGIHADAGIQNSYLVPIADPTVLVGPKPFWSDAAVRWACEVLLRLLRVLNDAFNLDLVTEIGMQESRVRHVTTLPHL